MTLTIKTGKYREWKYEITKVFNTDCDVTTVIAVRERVKQQTSATEKLAQDLLNEVDKDLFSNHNAYVAYLREEAERGLI